MIRVCSDLESFINQAAVVVFLVSGASKAPVLINLTEKPWMNLMS
jgi:hypothetical protein